ncbi:MAG: hypothetical protein E6Q97_17945 [Desulfurellales bacterium]|nr:MAG: hypothetical protein E6Q97_17945 [Desulfurellales bacterium]
MKTRFQPYVKYPKANEYNPTGTEFETLRQAAWHVGQITHDWLVIEVTEKFGTPVKVHRPPE